MNFFSFFSRLQVWLVELNFCLPSSFWLLSLHTQNQRVWTDLLVCFNPKVSHLFIYTALKELLPVILARSVLNLKWPMFIFSMFTGLKNPEKTCYNEGEGVD